MDHVKLSVYNLTGQLIETLINDQQDSGSYTLIWDASNQSSGMYFIRMQSGNFDKTIKTMLIK